MGEQGIVGTEQDTVGPNDVAHAPKNLGRVEERRSRGVVENVSEERAGITIEFMEWKSPAPMCENKGILREVCEKLDEFLERRRYLRLATNCCDRIGHMKIGRDPVFVGECHEA